MAKDRVSAEPLVEEERGGVVRSCNVFNELQDDGDVYFPFGAAFDCDFKRLPSGRDSLLSDPLKPIPKQTLELAKAIQKAFENAHENLDPPVKYAIKEMFVSAGTQNTATRAVAVVRKSGKPLPAAVVNTIVKEFSERILVPKKEMLREHESSRPVPTAQVLAKAHERPNAVEEDIVVLPERNLDHAAVNDYERKVLAAVHASADDFVRANPGKRMSATVVTPGAEVRYSGETPLPQNRETPQHPIAVRCRIDVVAIKAYRVSFIEAAQVTCDAASSATEAAWIPESFEAALGLDAKSEAASPKEMLKKVFSLTNEGAYLVDAHVVVRESRGRTRYRVVAIESAGTAQQSIA